MGCAQSKETTPAGKLSLPQSLSEAERKERSDALAKLRDTYAFADDPGMPPHPVLNKLNFPHELNKDERFAGGLAKKLGVFTKIIFLNIFEQSEVVCKEIADEAAQVAHHFKDHWAQLGKAETPPSHDHGPQDGRDALYKQFSVMFKKDFLDKQLPFNGVLTDEAFGVRVKTASAPYQLKRVDAIPEYVHITEEDVKGVLPEGDTLASLIAEKRLFKLDYQYLSKVKIWEQEKYQKMGWVVNPICFLYLTKDRELLLPCAVQLYPDPHTAANPVFTPKDPPGLWLAAKMFVINCSNNTHVCETHFMSGLTWVGLGMSLRRQVSRSHPISAFLEPFMYLFLGMWGGNRPPEDDIKTPVIRELWSQWNYQNVVTPNQLKHQGIDDAATLPHFYWRDDVQDLWATFHTLVSNMVNKVYASDDDIKADYEMQNFAKELVDPAICGYKGLEFDGAAKPITKGQLIELLTQCITGWTCRYQYDTFAWPWYVWIPFTPLSFTLPPPTTKDDISLETIRDHLIKPTSFEAGLQRTAIKIVTNAQVSKLTNGDAANPQHVPPFPGYMEGWPGGKEIVADYMKALNELEIKMKNRDAKVQTQAHNNIVFSMRPSIVQGSNAAI